MINKDGDIVNIRSEVAKEFKKGAFKNKGKGVKIGSDTTQKWTQNENVSESATSTDAQGNVILSNKYYLENAKNPENLDKFCKVRLRSPQGKSYLVYLPKEAIILELYKTVIETM